VWLQDVVGAWCHRSLVRSVGGSGVWVRVSLETVADLDSRSAGLDKFLVVAGLVHGELCSDIANCRVETRMNELGIVLLHHLLLNHGLILCLLRKLRAEEEKLSRDEDLQKQSVENCHTRPRVEGGQRKEYHVNQDMSRTEETSESQRNWERIPDRQLPNVRRPVRMSSRLRRFRCYQIREVAQGCRR
jgi:hypothetical protein